MSYVKKGGHGGKREGAGRTPGIKEVLPRGAVAAIRAMRHRVPEGTDEALAALADEALMSVVGVMRKPARRGALVGLMAAKAVREEVCGPIPKKHELTGENGGPVIVEIVRETVE